MPHDYAKTWDIKQCVVCGEDVFTYKEETTCLLCMDIDEPKKEAEQNP